MTQIILICRLVSLTFHNLRIFAMKFLVLSTNLLILLSLGNAQTNDFAPIGATWWYDALSDCGAPDNECGYFTLHSFKDTSILEQTCRVLKEEHFGNDAAIPIQFHYIYEDSGKVYFYRDGQFNLLYNFEAIQFDTINVFEDEFNGFTPFEDFTYEYFKYIIDSIAFVTIDGYELKTQFPKEINESNAWSFSYPVIIEGIGSTSLFFGQPNTIAIGFGSYLRCYVDENITFSNFAYDCDYITGLEGYLKHESLLVYPNPATDYVVLSFETPYRYALEVFDIYGRNLKPLIFIESNLSYILDVKDIKENIFFIKIIMENKQYYLPIFKL